MKKLDEGEYVEADHGYKGQPDKICLSFEAQNKAEIKRKGRALARHESINRLLKTFNALGKRWRHPIQGGQHKVVFDAVVTITQIGIDIGCIKPFSCPAPYKKKVRIVVA